MEILDVVNDEDEVIGSAVKQQIYAEKLCHRIVHVLVFNENNELALQLRGPSVSYLPLHWSTSVGGHVDTGESYETAALREMQEELGIQVPVFEFKKYQFELPDSGLKKFLGVFRATYSGKMNPGEREVADVVWKSLDEVQQMIVSGEKFHPELLFILQNL